MGTLVNFDAAGLSAKWCFHHPDLPLSLTSTNSKDILEETLMAAASPLSEEEMDVLRQLSSEKFFLIQRTHERQ